MKTVLNPTIDKWSELTVRPMSSLDDVMPVVDEVFGAIQRQGDQAIQTYSEKFDGYQPERIEVDLADLKSARSEISAVLRDAIDKAYDNIYAFHKAQQTDRVQLDVQEGVLCWQEKRPIEKVGLYIPGGTAPCFPLYLCLPFLLPLLVVVKSYCVLRQTNQVNLRQPSAMRLINAVLPAYFKSEVFRPLAG